MFCFSDAAHPLKNIRARQEAADKTAYVLTYTAANADFDEYLPAAERIMRSIRISP